ncbi:hypothetical protein A2716_01690 [candidate division WWE3 bacterium RIFCSPHIGHO2_01_FULL_40_23]|nr:MAG: hypothetical protein A2716_01690 [candidate division WWE3 bacterium RIFCSPHIGHO2_01_FULL_40_23]
MLIILIFTGSLGFLLLNKAPQIWDSAAHINLSMLYAYKIKEGSFKELLTLSGYYPPLLHLAGGLFFMIFPKFNSQLWLIFFFYLLLLVFTYKLTISLYGKEVNNLSLLTCLILSLFPQIYTQTRVFLIDLMMTMLLAGGLYFLHTSNGLKSTGRSLAAFTFFSLAQLSKWYAFIFMPVPIIYELIRNKANFSRKAVVNLLSGIAVILVLNLPWYYLNYKSILYYFGFFQKGESIDPQSLFSLDALSEYIRLVSVYELYFVNFIIMLVGLAYLLVKKETHSKYYLFSILLPFFIMNLIVNKDSRFLMPLLLYFAVIISKLFINIIQRSRLAGSSLLILYLTVNITLYIFTSFNQLGYELPENLMFISYLISGPVKKYNWARWNPTEFSYRTDSWEVDNVYNYIKELTGKNSAKILFAVDYPYFNSVNFNSLQIYEKYSYDVRLTMPGEKLEDLTNFDIILTADKPGPESIFIYSDMIRINKFLKEESTDFTDVKTFTLPNNVNVYVYQRLDLENTQ